MASSSPATLVTSRRGFLAFIWFVVNVLSLIAFAVALIFGLSTKDLDEDEYYQNYYNNGEGNSGDRDNEDEMDPELAVTSRAIAFAAMWTAVLAVLLSIFGTVILGWQSPTGQYYTCCSSQVHRTTPITLGGFIGSLLMFANLALVCAALFGEFEVRDYRDNDHDRNRDGEGDDQAQHIYFAVRRTSMAFSILCLFLAGLYGSFAALVLTSSNRVLEELAADQMEDFSETINRVSKSGLAPGVGSPRLSSKTSASHFVRPHHEVVYHKHTHSTSSLGGYVSPGTGAPPASQGTMA
ncbi:hypothetical protein ACA910_004881 [Epithemia clementina (nom. ined.)]